MKLIALSLVVGGWLVAMGGLVATEATRARMAMALLGLGTSIGGILSLNGTYTANALWKARGR